MGDLLKTGKRLAARSVAPRRLAIGRLAIAEEKPFSGRPPPSRRVGNRAFLRESELMARTPAHLGEALS